MPRPAARAVPPAPSAVAPPPRTWRDPWAWASVLAALPLAWAMRGAPWGEPVAEDFDFLHHALFTGVGSLLDGGGSLAFWRPIPHQLYYAALAPLLLARPAAVAGMHLALLALGSLLLYRTLRPSWSGPLAAAAASFPLLAESVRTIVGWPTQFVDLGVFVAVALALHETSRRRLPTALAALFAALLCKEVAVVAALLLPFLPSPLPWGRRARVRWALATWSVTAAWALLYLYVRRTAHLELPHGVEHDAAVLATPLATRVVWAFGGSLKALASLTRIAGPRDLAVLRAGVVLFATGLLWLVVDRVARARAARARGWIAWGLAWFALASLALTPIFPMWQPNRSQFGSLGLGIAAIALLGAAHPLLAWTLALGRVALLGLAPGTATSVSALPPDTGAFIDFQRLTRLQLFMRAARGTLKARYPTLPRGAGVAQQNLPQALQYALGGDHALQVWYRDSTLRWVHNAEFRARPDLAVATVLRYQISRPDRLVLVEPQALRTQIAGYELLQQSRWAEALAAFARAESLQVDTAATEFRAYDEGRSAYVLVQLGRFAEGERRARRALALDPTDANAAYVLALALAQQRRYDESELVLDALARVAPADPDAQSLRAAIAEARARGAAATPSH